jgi:hypothetical protein
MMDIEQLLHPTTAVVAYCNVINNTTVALGYLVNQCNLDCDNCHILQYECYTINVNRKKFKESLSKNKDISCVLFFDNYSDNKTPKDNELESEALIPFFKAAHECDLNVCLFSTDREEIPKTFKKYLTSVKG